MLSQMYPEAYEEISDLEYDERGGGLKYADPW